MAKKQSKYRNCRTVVDGITFASKKEAKRYGELKLLQQSGRITSLYLQVPFEIHVLGHKICKYVADFVYVDENKRTVVEDVKGVRTREYIMKRKLMRAVYGIEITEV